MDEIVISIDMDSNVLINNYENNLPSTVVKTSIKYKVICKYSPANNKYVILIQNSVKKQ